MVHIIYKGGSVAALAALVLTAAVGYANETSLVLRQYSKAQVDEAFSRIGGGEKFSGDIVRTSDGATLRFLDWANRRVISASCDGQVSRDVIPGDRNVWLDDSGKAVAWMTGGNGKFAGGQELKGGFNLWQADFGARYFVRRPGWPDLPGKAGGIRIFSAADPIHSLVVVEHVATPIRIFTSMKFLLLVAGRDIVTFDAFDRAPDGSLKEHKRFEVRRPRGKGSPFNAIDADLDEGKVLFVDVSDPPFGGSSTLLLFDLASRQFREIGPSMHYNGLLACDVLSRTRQK
jgi:hypothetical protein